MWQRLLADALVLAHGAFVAFVALGALAVLWRRWVLWLHLPALAWGILIELRGWICPLTRLENAFRRSAGEAGYEGGFVEHYVVPVLYPAALDRELQLNLALAAAAVNLVIYAFVAARWRRRPAAG
ncbi:MAG: DUF2784 domain-containing protein [Acidobacteria bacterium]|nr:MAG: DUF2784 domain-containing protein [Acidobacteriota bacterium]